MANVLFVCLHNAGRSQMSQALFELAAGGRHRAASAGTAPAERVHPEVVEVMRELDVDLSQRTPRRLTTELAGWADLVVTMGCGDECPYIPGKRYLDWDLPDPKGRPVEEVRATRDEIRRRVEDLVKELGQVEVRDATDEDLPATLAIYNQLAADTTVVWSDRAETLEERRAWVAARRARGFPVLVAVDRQTGEVIGIATYGDFRDSQYKPGYRFTVEHSIHIRQDRTGRGIGAVLLDELTRRARSAGVHVMIAGADAGNVGGIRFHQRHGFVEVARFLQVGRKFGRWLDLVFLQRVIGDERRDGEDGGDAGPR